MVTRVYGRANGKDIIFNKDSWNRWSISVPWVEDGEYIVEIYADDEAGNVAYICSMVFIIIGHSIQGYVVERGFEGNGKTSNYEGYQTISKFLGGLKKESFELTADTKQYKSDLREGGYTIESTICCRNGS